MGNANLSGIILLLICLLIDPAYAASTHHKTTTKQTSSKKHGSKYSSSKPAYSKHAYVRHGYAKHHRANRYQGPTVEQVPEEIFPPGHLFTPEEKAEASEIGILVQNGMWKEAFKASSKAAKAHPERWWLQAARAAAASNLNRPKDVIDAVDAALRTNAGDANRLNLAQLYTLRANALSRLGRKSEALSNFQSAISLSKTDSVCRAGAAWVYATSADPRIRNGATAVALATEAAKLSAWKDDTVLDVLAASYAEVGDFKSAQKWEEKAILMGSAQDIPFYQHRLLNYQLGRPWREDSK
jgi:tetratricopeptide (TPR) repeat protein